VPAHPSLFPPPELFPPPLFLHLVSMWEKEVRGTGVASSLFFSFSHVLFFLFATRPRPRVLLRMGLTQTGRRMSIPSSLRRCLFFPFHFPPSTDHRRNVIRNRKEGTGEDRGLFFTSPLFGGNFFFFSSFLFSYFLAEIDKRSARPKRGAGSKEPSFHPLPPPPPELPPPFSGQPDREGTRTRGIYSPFPS